MRAGSKFSLVSFIPNTGDARLFGENASNLSKAGVAGFDVPKGFAISADAYRMHLWAAGVRRPTSQLAGPRTIAEIRSHILDADVPLDIVEALKNAYHRLSLLVGFPNPIVAVRPSPSLNGQPHSVTSSLLSSFTKVSGVDSLIVAVKEVWASLWSVETGGGDCAMAVLVQNMLSADYTGLARTTDPKTGNPNLVCITVALKDQSETARTWVFDLAKLDYATEHHEVVGPSRDVLNVVADKAVLLEKEFEGPILLEWAWDSGWMWVLHVESIVDSYNYFPVQEHSYPASGVLIRRTEKPISLFAQSVLSEAYWQTEKLEPFLRTRAPRVIHGHVYQLDSAHDLAGGNVGAINFEKVSAPRACETLRSFKPDEADGKALSTSIDTLVRQWRRRALELTSSRAASAAARKQLGDQLAGVVGSTEPLLSKLLMGVASPVIARDQALRDLAERFGAARRNGVSDDPDWWRIYRADVESLGREYGWSFTRESELYDPDGWMSWAEDIEPLLRIIKALSEAALPESLLQQQVNAAESAGEALTEVLELFSIAKRRTFETRCRRMRAWISHYVGAEIECARAAAIARCAILNAAKLLQSIGVLDDPTDVFYLSRSELCRALERKQGFDAAEIRFTLARAKHEAWIQHRLRAPQTIGKIEPVPDSELRRISGRSISPGMAEGRIVVLDTYADLSDVQKGDILVVREAAFAWTPMLAIVGGIVAQEDTDMCPEAYPAKLCGVPVLVGCRGILNGARSARKVRLDTVGGFVDLA